MSITTQIISGSISALNLIKNYLANPSIAPDIGSGITPTQDFTQTVPIQCESYKEVLDSDVSSQLIVDVSIGKTYVSDNIAPKPRVWELKGYIGAAPWELIASPVLQVIQGQRQQYLRDMYKSREMLVFRTKNGTELVYVGMKSLSFDSDPAIQNRIPVTMTLQEIPILSYVNGQLGIPSGSANPAAAGELTGQAFGQVADIASIALSLGSTAIDQTIAVASALNVPAGKTLTGQYIIPFPGLQPGQVSSKFTANIAGQIYTFNLRWNSIWNVQVTFPDGSIRYAALQPNVMNWAGYPDMGLVAVTPLMSIGQFDLGKIQLFMVTWR